MEVSLTYIFLLCLTAIFLVRKLSTLFSKKNYPKGPFGLPVVGHLPFFGQSPPITFMKWWRKYGDIFGIQLGSWKAVVVNGYRAVKAAAEHPGDAFSGRPNFVSMQVLTDREGEDSFAFGNFTPAYVKQRKYAAMALRMFTANRPEVVEKLVVKEAKNFAKILIEKYRTIPGYVEFDVQTLVVRVMYQFLYGRDKHVDIEKYVKVIMDMLHDFNTFCGAGSPVDVLPWLRYIMPWKIDMLRKIITSVDDIMFEQVNEHYKSFTADNIRDVADAILASHAEDEENKNKEALTRSRLNMTLSDLQGAGSDTTNKTLSWLFLYMAAYPQVQQRVQTELDDVIGRDRDVTLDDKPQLVYTNAAIQEVWRIVTPLPFSVPHFSMLDAKIEGYDVDKDSVVFFNIYSVHHDNTFWGDPENFRPERLIRDDHTLDEDKCKHIIPFSLGRRRCVGEFLAKMNVFLTFATVMKKCEIVKPEGEILDLIPNPGLVYYPTDFKVFVKERE